MSRPPRPDIPGSLHHVILRGNNRQDVFTTSTTRRAFLDHVADAVARLECRVHAYCLMTNHIHLALQQGDVPLSRIVQFLAQRHAVETNRARGASGHLFQGRFSSSLVETDAYLLDLVRYIHLNPVRAGLVASPEAWPWSSHPAYIGLASRRFLTTELVLGMLGTSEEAPARFREFVLAGREDEAPESGVGPPRRRLSMTADPLAPATPPLSPDFARDALRRRDHSTPRPVPLEHVVSIVLAETGLTEADLASGLRPRGAAYARTEIAWLALRAPSASLTAVARRCHRDLSTLSDAVGKLESASQSDRSLRRRLERLLRLARHAPQTRAPDNPTTKA